MRELTDGGTYTCHFISDLSNQYDIHFSVEIDRELKILRGYVKIINNNNKIAIDVTGTDTDANAPASIGVNQYLTTAIRKPHLIITTKSSSHSSNIVEVMVRRTTTGDGPSSIQKRHINSFDTTSTVLSATIITTTTSPISSIPVLHSNKPHQSTLSDLELTTANAAATTIQATIVPLTADNLYPYSRGKRNNG